jgi:hypothetical protein
LKTTKTKPGDALSDPVWCHRCSIRIAPYDLRTVHQGKVYHRDCYAKLNQEKGQTRKT